MNDNQNQRDEDMVRLLTIIGCMSTMLYIENKQDWEAERKEAFEIVRRWSLAPKHVAIIQPESEPQYIMCQPKYVED